MRFMDILKHIAAATFGKNAAQGHPMVYLDHEDDFNACIGAASNALLEARRCLCVAIDIAPDGTAVGELWNAMTAAEQWADWLNPPREGGYGGDNIVRFPVERRG
jgi:hypothetical protein